MTDAILVRHRLTVHDYHRMAEAGILKEADRVELIDGNVLDMAPIGPDHHGTVLCLTDRITAAVAAQALVSVQRPLRLDDDSEPQPDFVVLRRRPDFYRGAHATPRDVLLLVEVSDSSLRFDRAVKLPMYARHGIPEVWIVNLPQRPLEVHRDPTPDGYRRIETHEPDATISPVGLPDLRIDLRELLG